MIRLIHFLLIGTLLALFSCKQMNPTNHHSNKVANKLVDESSPYLLQHAYNPVQWYPWGEEALNKAKAENKMMIISVGYAACHWCHVMEHESFEDSTVAQIMNDNFVCIKVDREERPDVDDVYMTACHLSSGRSCGWPLNAFALADGRPVWAGTYFPQDQWLKILKQFIKIKTTDEASLVESADKIMEGIEGYESIDINSDDLSFTQKEMDEISKTFLGFIDFKKGGRKTAPKFPMPNNYEFLLKYHHLSGNTKAMDAVSTTLDKMALGGIYDQLGGGFARYSTDDIWLAPHFEKMLYDNGQLISLYAHAYQKTKNPLYEQVVRESIEFSNRELRDNDGGYYSSLDADSEGVEGKFYVWDKSEIDSIIGDERNAKIFNDYYSVKNNGNWEHTNILNVRDKIPDLIEDYKLSETELSSILSSSKAKLFKHRATRIRPGTDDKVLTAWNGLMLSGLVDAYTAFGDQAYLDQALTTAKFILNKQKSADHRLNRNYKNAKSSINGFLDDYSSTIQGFVKLYQATFDESWLREAEHLSDYALTHFFKKENGMFNFTSDLDPPLVVRKSEIGDNVIPGSNSMMADNLFTLGLLLDRKDYKDISKQMLKNVLPQILKSGQPHFYSNWCKVYLDQVKPPYEVAIVGENAEAVRKEFAKKYIANALVIGGTTEGSLSLLKGKLQEGNTMIYVCQNKVCKFPVSEVDKAIELMN